MKYKMLEYEKNDVSEGIDVNKSRDCQENADCVILGIF